MTRRLPALAAALVACGASPAAAQQPATEIPGPLDGPLPRYSGSPATVQPLRGPWLPANPALAADGRSGSGLASGNGAASPFAGPLGHATAGAGALQYGTCASLALDARDRLLAVCNGPVGPALRLVDPGTLATIATLTLPARTNGDRTDVAGGSHFVVRADGSLLVPTNAGTLLTVVPEESALRQTRSTPLGLGRSERPFAVGAGFDGRDWVVGTNGTVIAIPRRGGQARALALREPVTEDIATDPTGTYVVTRDALYRLRALSDGTPRVVWRHRLPSGSGTPPAVVAGGYVAVADRVSPARIIVLRRTGSARRRLACSVPVLRPGASRITSHLVVAGRSIVASNNAGYDNPGSTEFGRTAVGGMVRVIVGRRGCRVAWTSPVVSPSAQPVVSRATGLLYTLAKPAGFPDAWNLAALDWRTGDLRFQALAGEGLGYNSEGGALLLAPGGTAFAGTFGGVVRFRDTGGPSAHRAASSG